MRRAGLFAGLSIRNAALAFTLVEVVLAIGVIAFAFVALLGLLPIGLSTFRHAVDISVTAQIAQRVIGDAQEADFDALADHPQNVQQGEFFILPLRYFDDQGTEIDVADSAGGPSADERSRIIYVARVRGSKPGDPDPAQHAITRFTLFPTSDDAPHNPRDVTFLTIQIATNPGNRPLPIDNETQLYKSAAGGQRNQMITYSTVVARNGHTRKP